MQLTENTREKRKTDKPFTKLNSSFPEKNSKPFIVLMENYWKWKKKLVSKKSLQPCWLNSKKKFKSYEIEEVEKISKDNLTYRELLIEVTENKQENVYKLLLSEDGKLASSEEEKEEEEED